MMDHKGIAYAFLQKAFTLAATGNTPVVFGPGENWPEGIIRRIWCRVWASAITLNSGSGIAGGGLNLIRTFHLSTSPHKVLYPDVDSKLYNRFVLGIEGRAPGATDPTSSGFSQMLPIILAVPDQLRRPAFRKNDLSLLNYRNQAKPTLRLALGPITDIVSGGTAPTCSGNVDLVIEYEPNPQPGKYNPVTPAASGDEPGLQVDCQVALISSLGSQPEAPLPTGQGRTLLAMLIREEQPSTSPVTEVSNIFTANTSAFTLKYGSDNIVDGVPLTTLDQIMQHKENVSLTAGTHLYIPAEDGKTADGVNVRDGRDLRAKFTAIANSADRELQLLCFFGRDVEEGATFAAQAKASQSQ